MEQRKGTNFKLSPLEELHGAGDSIYTMHLFQVYERDGKTPQIDAPMAVSIVGQKEEEVAFFRLDGEAVSALYRGTSSVLRKGICAMVANAAERLQNHEDAVMKTEPVKIKTDCDFSLSVQTVEPTVECCTDTMEGGKLEYKLPSQFCLLVQGEIYDEYGERCICEPILLTRENALHLAKVLTEMTRCPF